MAQTKEFPTSDASEMATGASDHGMGASEHGASSSTTSLDADIQKMNEHDNMNKRGRNILAAAVNVARFWACVSERFARNDAEVGSATTGED